MTNRGIRFSYERGPTRLEYPGFFHRDLLSRGAEILGVVDADRRDASGQRCQHVRGVEAPSETDFDDRDVDVRRREELEAHGRRGLEEGRAELLDDRGAAGDPVRDVAFRDLATVDQESLAKVD